MNFYEKHLARQADLEKIHARAVDETPVGGVDDNLMCVMRIQINDDQGNPMIAEESVLRRGYKIQWTAQTNMYELFRTTSTDYYKYVDDKDIDEFLKKGFIRVADEHQIKRDRARVENLNKKLSRADSERNDSLIIHWRNRRKELIEKISKIEENLN